MDPTRNLSMPSYQLSLALISHKVNEIDIPQRASDGYINATDMCKAAGRKISHYLENDSTTAFINELSSDAGIPASDLIQSVKGGASNLQGTWVHPDVAIHMGQWLSPKFSVMVSKWVREWISGNQPRNVSMPYHLRRHMLNIGKVPPTHFSILQELTNTLIAPMEANGYTLPESLMPDISQGRMFCDYARKQLGIDTDSLPTYEHAFENRRVVPAKLYPIEHLGAFRMYIAKTWMPEKAFDYFKQRDPQALPILDKVIQLTYAPTKKAANNPSLIKTRRKAA
jgi:KilA-N domain